MLECGQAEIDAIAEVLRSGQLFRYRGGEGGQADTCERMLRERFDSPNALVVTSGTGAIICGLVGLGIGPGDEVIVPAYTWLASAGAILSVGAIPILAEIDETLALDPADLEKRIGPRTKAVIPVHMRGRASDMDAIMSISRKHGLKVLEDACQAIGCEYKGQSVGAIGDVGTFSFNHFKTIACGEGGAVLVKDRDTFERALYYHDMGCTFRRHAGTLTTEPFLGNTFRMNEILCAMLRVQLGRLDGILAKLSERCEWITDAVESESEILKISPNNDRDGDCGQYVSFLFGDIATRERFDEKGKELLPDCSFNSPINSGLHVYTNWHVLMNKQGGFVPAMNPYLRAENSDCRKDITPDSCPRTLDIMARTSMVGVNHNWSREECEAVAAGLCKAAKA